MCHKKTLPGATIIASMTFILAPAFGILGDRRSAISLLGP